MVGKRDRAATRADLEGFFSGVSSRFDRLEVDIGGLKTGVAGLEAKFGGLQAKVGGLEAKVGGLEAKFGGLQAKVGGLEAKVDGLTANVRNLNLGYTALNAGMKDLATGLRREMADLKTAVTAQVEPFTGRMETIWRESVVYPRMLDQQGARLDAHDRRLTALEAGRDP